MRLQVLSALAAILVMFCLPGASRAEQADASFNGNGR